jgi:hypothetical protein
MSGAATAALLLSLACGSTSSTTSAGPSPAKCQVSASNTTPTFRSTGGEGAIAVQAARECGWSASASAPWIALGATTGRGDMSLKYTVQANDAGLPRRASVVVSGQPLDVAQEAAPCRFSVDRTVVDVAAAESTPDVVLQAPAGCAWTASSQSGDWVSVLDSQGTGPGRVRIRVLANSGPARIGSITAAGVRVEIRQAGAGQPPPPAPPPTPPGPEPPPPPPPAECEFSFSPDSASVGAAGGDGEVQLATGAECEWTIQSDAPWLSLRSAAQGRGGAKVVYRVAANAETAPRTGRLVAATASFTVHQAGASEPPPPPPPACSFEVSPLQHSLPATGGTGSVNVKSAKDCAWTAESHDSWIVIKKGESGTGDGTVDFEVAANIGAARTGTLVVAGQTVTIEQAALVGEEEVTVQGDIANLQGTCPVVTFALGTDSLQTTAVTLYRTGSCGKLKNGISVRAKGVRAPILGTITITEVEFTKIDQIAE